MNIIKYVSIVSLLFVMPFEAFSDEPTPQDCHTPAGTGNPLCEANPPQPEYETCADTEPKNAGTLGN